MNWVVLPVADIAWPLTLQRILREGLIRPAFQPIVDLARGVVCGYEGLTRIPELEDLNPAELYAAAAWHGYTGRLEAMSLKLMLSHYGSLPRNCFLSLNLSPGALQAPEVDEVFDREPDLRGVVLEITEQTPVDDYDELVSRLAGLRSRGAVIAVDDAGAGYASISHLLALRPEFVKLDRSLITGIDGDQHRAAAVSALGAFANELDAWLIAEGVENGAELERLIDLGVPLVQGFLLGRPERDMRQLSALMSSQVRRGQARRRADRLSSLARRAPHTSQAPERLVEVMVLVDEDGRPLQVLEPGGGRRAHRHPAMCVQPTDGLRNVALRATARPSENRYAPVCLCDELGRYLGLIELHVLLESLARGVPERH